MSNLHPGSFNNFNSWWGRHSVEPNRTHLWQLGAFHFWIQNLNHEWRLSWSWSGEWLDSRARVVQDAGSELPPPDAMRVSCATSSFAREDVLFQPVLADRSLVARLETPLEILRGDTANLYVLSPLRLRIEMSETATNPAPNLLQEIATSRLSDTWFGPMSSFGELCYASSVPAFLDLNRVPMRLQCAISAVSIHNSGSNALRVERINVPLPKLSLFHSPRTGFWTDGFSLDRKDDSEMASLRLHRQPPPEAAPSQFISGPRASAESSNSMVRAFSALFRDRNAT